LIGRTLDHYTITAKLGEGGMGEVYAAEDTRLGRQVALKFLPEGIVDSPETLERFKREARTASALNHPHVCTIHDIGEHDGRPFIVMELLQGRTLAEQIASGSMTVDEILRLTIQIADALHAAHAEGVVHRDIKPANLFVTARGDAKILDFGLAKPGGERVGPESGVETVLAETHLTRPGTTLGTVAYMSPEQALGKEVDQRSDLFSLGVVLYEMATGTQPFTGTATGAVLNEIINGIPLPATRRNPALPDELVRVLDKSLEKDPELRYQSARELMADLKRVRRDSSASVPTASSTTSTAGRARSWGARLAVGLIAVVAVAVGWRLVSDRDQQVPQDSFEITPFTTDRGWKEWPQLSPDGEKVAYVWYREGADSGDLFVKALGVGTRPLALTETPSEELSPVWSPDGREIAFARIDDDGRGAIYLIPALGGQERKVAELGTSGDERRKGSALSYNTFFQPALSWSPDGTWLAVADRESGTEPGRIVKIDLESLERTTLTSPAANSMGDMVPALSPDGRHLAFMRSGSASWGDVDVWIQPLDTGPARRLTFGSFNAAGALTWTPSSDEVIFTTAIWGGGTIHRVHIDGGKPRQIPGIGENTGFVTLRRNRLVYQQRTTTAPSIWRTPGRSTPAADRTPFPLIDSMWIDFTPAISPDGQKIAFQSSRGGDYGNIWVCNQDGSEPIQLTRFTKHSGTPRWSPDGRRIVFDSLESGNWDIWVVDAEGGTPQQLTIDSAEDGTPFWSRNGRWIYFHSTRSGESQIWRMEPGGGDLVQITEQGGFYAEESWDGSALYYAKSNIVTGIWRKALGGDGDEEEIIRGPIYSWGDFTVARNGIYFGVSDRLSAYEASYRLLFFDFSSGEVTELLRRDGASEHMFLAASPDEEWLLFAETPSGRAELMLVENFR
jgi:Tol biopolymer transport system component/serine/threonine protein kinase